MSDSGTSSPDSVKSDGRSGARPERVLYRAFQDIDSHFDDVYQLYRELYADVPVLKSEVALTDGDAFAYCAARRYFVLVCPYTNHRELLVERSFTDSGLSWSLLGGSVRRDAAESFIDAASRHAEKAYPDILLGEIEPIAFLHNRFTYGDQVHDHWGVALVARIRNENVLANVRNTLTSRAYLLPLTSRIPNFSLAHNFRVAELALEYLATNPLETVPEHEIAENLEYRARYAFHDRFVKPAFNRWGRRGFEHSLADLSKEIHDTLTQCEPGGRFLDVACGDNRLVYDLARSDHFGELVGNDVSWSQVQLLGDRRGVGDLRDHAALTLFTNHDARRLPFADKSFDVVFCKNTLHHMDSLQSVRRLLVELIRVGKMAVVVEILDPSYESRWGRLRHQYYLQFLKDAGEHFLSRREFLELTDVAGRTKMSEMRTVRGIYQFAVFGGQV